MRPAKVDGPGPGSHKLPSSIKVAGQRTAMSTDGSVRMATTFGNAARAFSNLPQDTPAPNMYRPIKFTESSHAYSFPKQADDGNVLKGATLPGPQSYNQVGMADLNHRACRILGGKLGKTVEE